MPRINNQMYGKLLAHNIACIGNTVYKDTENKDDNNVQHDISPNLSKFQVSALISFACSPYINALAMLVHECWHSQLNLS